MKDDLGDRMKRDYESRTRFLLPRRTYTLLRIDGMAFHTYTHKRTGEEQTAMALRSAWVSVEPPIFTREREWLQSRVPEFGL